MKKLEKYVANKLIRRIRNQYGLHIHDESARSIARSMIHEYNKRVEGSFQSKESTLYRAVDAYYASTKMPRQDKVKHSAYWFAVFLNKHYRVILLRKNYLQRLLAKWYNKVTSIWR